jgi:hypothetical protein
MYIVFKEVPIHQVYKKNPRPYCGYRWSYYYGSVLTRPEIVGDTHMHVYICETYKNNDGQIKQRYLKKVYSYFPKWTRLKKRSIITRWLIYYHIRKALKELNLNDKEKDTIMRHAKKYVRPLNEKEKEIIKAFAQSHDNKIRVTDTIT